MTWCKAVGGGRGGGSGPEGFGQGHWVRKPAPVLDALLRASTSPTVGTLNPKP